MAVCSLKLLGWGGGGAVQGLEGHPADDDDLASEKGHFFQDYRGAAAPPPPPPARYGPDFTVADPESNLELGCYRCKLNHL